MVCCHVVTTVYYVCVKMFKGMQAVEFLDNAYIWFLDLAECGWIRQFCGCVNELLFSVWSIHDDFVYHRWCCDNQVQVILSL